MGYFHNKKLFITLGADNVGKTTMLMYSMKFAREVLNKEVFYLHFSAPKKGENPCDMYYEALEKLVPYLDRYEYVYLDRAWPESKFYEQERRGVIIPYEEVLEVEKTYQDLFKKYGYESGIYLMYKNWDFIRKFHIQELEKNQEFVQESKKLNDEPDSLGARKLEYGKYYHYMQDYCNTRTYLDPSLAKRMSWNIINTTDLHFTLI